MPLDTFVKNQFHFLFFLTDLVTYSYDDTTVVIIVALSLEIR